MKGLSEVRKFYLYSYIGLTITNGCLTAYLFYRMKSGPVTTEFIGSVCVCILVGFIVSNILLFRIISKISDELSRKNKELIESKMNADNVIRKLDYSYREIVSAASAAIDARDAYTAGHSNRVSKIACKIGYELGLSDNQLDCLELASLFHDIGKIGVPDNILNKPGKLNEDEYKMIKIHPELGYNILKNIEFLSPMLSAILYHHERPDGKGYPEGLRGEEIPIGASIISLADTYDAITSNRPYRNALSHEQAVEELKKQCGTQFKIEVVDAFLKIENELN